MASFFYTMEIYFDFSGYSDIAIGTAKLLGIDLTINFKSPYFSTSMKEFWRRWHISLSQWLRDYVYIPLGGNKKGKIRQKINVIIAFLLSGLWHGASWKFVIWGWWHGIFQATESGWQRLLLDERLKKIMAWLVTFLCVSTLWILFRAESFMEAGDMVTRLYTDIISPFDVYHGVVEIDIPWFSMIIIVFMIILIGIYDFLSMKIDLLERMTELPLRVRYAICIFCVLLVIMVSRKGPNVVFVYENF